MTGPPYRRYSGWPDREYAWAVSPWDHRAHAHLELNADTSEAICGHQCRTSTLVYDDGTVPECFGCMSALGQNVPDLLKLRAHWEQWRQERRAQ